MGFIHCPMQNNTISITAVILNSLRNRAPLHNVSLNEIYVFHNDMLHVCIHNNDRRSYISDQNATFQELKHINIRTADDLESTPTTFAPNLFCHRDRVKAGLRLGLAIGMVFGPGFKLKQEHTHTHNISLQSC